MTDGLDRVKSVHLPALDYVITCGSGQVPLMIDHFRRAALCLTGWLIPFTSFPIQGIANIFEPLDVTRRK